MEKLTNFYNANLELDRLKVNGKLTHEEVTRLKTMEIINLESFLTNLKQVLSITGSISINSFKEKYDLDGKLYQVFRKKKIIENKGKSSFPDWKWTSKAPDKHMASAILQESGHPFFTINLHVKKPILHDNVNKICYVENKEIDKKDGELIYSDNEKIKFIELWEKCYLMRLKTYLIKYKKGSPKQDYYKVLDLSYMDAIFFFKNTNTLIDEYEGRKSEELMFEINNKSY